ncbi:MAG TPA: YtxH domain-containing protein, partial [Nitrospiraceae bacterium]|nr:YtxH domain-containing protein [Nitrospiraceae bacterium]
EGGTIMGSSDRHESGNLSTFITGAVIGAGIALLFAPQAGVELRRLLCGYAARAQEEFDKTIYHGTEMLDSAVERGQEFVEKGKDSLRETGRQAKEFAEAGRKAFKETKDEFSSQHH